ncbi:hypothetical protein HPB52_005163 [Rhipicephalus sanguineus]|uniref:Peptidase M13 N-terminal domain-containing protein n=1 Tax=Rhipicephalus sanguineus TaxID=34632 RepID=A0A9D4PBZ8_RHISA|nr:hypothetical protein HPB52_005163 [Rhipicephalus sanguineus]
MQSANRASRDAAEGFYFAAICSMFVILAFALGALYFVNAARHRARSEPLTARRTTCDSRDCQRHALLLTVGLNRTADPCRDFSAYVCSAWTPGGSRPHPSANALESQLNDVLIAWLGGLEDLLISGIDVHKVASKPLALLRSCQAPGRRASADDLADFREFITLLGLCWPDDSCCDVSALGVLLGLVYRWDLCFWLRIRILRKHNGSERRLALYPAPRALVERFVARHTYLVMQNAYLAYWTHHRDVLLSTNSASNESSSRHPPQDDIERVIKTEHSIARALLHSATKETLEPMKIPISDIGYYTANVSSSEWLDKLNANVADESTLFAMEEQILVADASVLGSIGTIFGFYTDREILSHLSWQFVQEYSAVVDPGLEHLFEDRWGALFCARQVAEIYAPLVATLHWKLHASDAERRLLEAKLRNLVYRTAMAVKSQWWLAEQDKHVAVEKLRALTVRLWPPMQLERELGQLFHDFPNGTASDESFAKTWIKSRTALAGRATSRSRSLIASYSPTLSPLMIRYDYLDNAVDLAASSLMGPLFYVNATPSMFYGGIGFYFAAQMMRFLDWTGLKVDAGGRVVSPSWMTDVSRKVVASRLSCPTTSVTNKALLPYLPALEVVRQAFIEEAATSLNRLDVGGELTEPRTFFMTLCRMACSSTPWAGAVVDCNTVLKNSRDFATTYRCKIDSPMNPSKKCVFFS